MADQPSNLLQTAVQSVGWTYSLFWQLCPQQGILVWGDGYYNGAIRTRKTVQPMEVSTEEASLNRSEQLRELYDFLAATTGDTNQPARRSSAALSPEDLTESEWFYLMCVSFSFHPGVGLPGKAYTTRKHVWLTGASDVDSKVFSRSILAQSARVQTVMCIPLLDGVIELGTTEKVQEDLGFVKRVMSFFTDHTWSFPPKPPLCGHSTSNSAISPTMPPPIYTPVVPMEDEEGQEHEEEEQDSDDNEEAGEDDEEDEDTGEEEEEEEEDEENEEEEEEEEAESDAEAETGNDSRYSSVQTIQAMADQDANTSTHDHALVEPNELMHHDLSEGIRFGSPDDGSNYLDSDFHMLAVRQAQNFESELQGYKPVSGNCLQLQAPGAPQPEELTQEDSHYSHTVSAILHHQSNRYSDASTASCYAIYSAQSAFAKWTSQLDSNILHHPGPSQWVLKYVLFTIPYLHTKPCDGATAESETRFRKGYDTNHVLAERRRREKLNERFIILRSIVPFVTKMDKASILGDTIEYLKQLRKRIQDLEAPDQRLTGSSLEKRKVRKMEGDYGAVGKPKAMEAPPQSAVEVEVSIIESDALVEMQCPYREGLLLDAMKVLRELRVEITTVQSSLIGGLFTVEIRAKVKENVSGKKLSITQVKRAINQIIPNKIY